MLVIARRFLPALTLLVLMNHIASAQTDTLSAPLKSLTITGSTPEWMKFQTDSAIDPTTLFGVYHDAFDLCPSDSMKQIGFWVDSLGLNVTSHYRYQAYHKTINGHPDAYGGNGANTAK